jgi:DNA repair exonuclease SbcCD ATPase subunit
MLIIKNLTVKNFLSVGNVTQAVKMNQNGLTLVIGLNLDMGGEGARNGVGKTTIVNALSYALYGNALSNIRKDNLINKTNDRSPMLVTVEFEKNGHTYRIERGRKPNVFRFIVNNDEVTESGTNEGQGENKLTQEAVERILGMSHEMFKHIMALNTYNEPFLAMRNNDKKAIIEELLGITLLSEKAELLKDQMRGTRDTIKEEEFRIKALQETNAKIQSSIEDIERRSRIWAKKKEDDLIKLVAAINELETIDINQELSNHSLLTAWKENEQKTKRYTKDLANAQAAVKRLSSQIIELTAACDKAKEHKCHACGQDLHDDQQTSMIDELNSAIMSVADDLERERVLELEAEKKIFDVGNLGPAPRVRYADINDAVNHKSSLENLRSQLDQRSMDNDPYQDQIETLRNKALEEVNWNRINTANKKLEHQEFLYKLLTNKDSFVRRRIIEQNLSYLNHRLNHYLTALQLPHEVTFQSDLTVDIRMLGQEFDFDNLSRGERNRLILGLSWSFRDVFESLNFPCNLLFIDELIDSGMDPVGVDSALAVLKKFSRESGKNVFLISHRDELITRVNNSLQVVKENGFTTFSTDVDIIEA